MMYQVDLLFYIDLFKRSWKIILTTVAVTMFLTFCYASFFTPTVYMSSVTLLPVGGGFSPAVSGSGLAQFLGLTQGTTASGLGSALPILKSKRMARDISEHFKLNEKPRFWYTVNTKNIDGGYVEVRGSDPALTEQIANFCIENLDKINTELDYVVNKPMVKVLDPATYGAAEPKNTIRPVIVSGLLSFFLCVLYLVSREYLRKARAS